MHHQICQEVVLRCLPLKITEHFTKNGSWYDLADGVNDKYTASDCLVPWISFGIWVQDLFSI